MKASRKKKAPSPILKKRLSELEEKAAKKGIQVHYDVLEAAGLKLKGGICKVKGEFHLFVDRRKPAADKIDMLRDYLDAPLPENVTQDNIEAGG